MTACPASWTAVRQSCAAVLCRESKRAISSGSVVTAVTASASFLSLDPGDDGPAIRLGRINKFRIGAASWIDRRTQATRTKPSATR
jgi:hypothetical protein